jgi:YesN/AraC family two-component response regulator
MTRVLVIDDERPTLAMFELILQAMGHEPVAADSGEKGLELFKDGDFPIVLTDIKMPGMDGMEVLRQIKAGRPATEVIVITGHGDVDLALAALNHKAADFIDKPISQQALATALRRAEERIDRRKAAEPAVVLRRAGEVSILNISGSLSTGMDELAQQLAKASVGAGFLVSVSACASINGAGISGLTCIIRDQAARGGRVAIACRPENFRRVFEATGLTALASLHEDEEDAWRELMGRSLP